MTTLYLMEPRSLVKKDADTLVVEIPANKEQGSKKRKVRVPLMKVDQVVVYGDVTLTSPALLALLEKQVDVCFLTFYGQFRGRLSGEFSKNAGLRVAQHRAAVVNNPKRALGVARWFVHGKLANMRTMLLRSNRKLQDEAVAQAAEQISTIIEQVQTLEADGYPPPDPSKPQRNTAWGRLLGLEGSGSASYFGVFGRLLKHGWLFEKRTRRPPTDPVNAMLSFGYTLLTNLVGSTVQLVGLDPYIGFLHGSKYGQPSLALDLVEEFRPLVVDSLVLRLINKKIIKPDDFEEQVGAYRLSDSARKTFLQQYEARLNEEFLHPVFDYRVSYRKAIEVQTRLLSRWLQGELPQYEPLLMR